VKPHELDELLRGLTPAEEALPENRVRVAAACFQREVNRDVALPPTPEERPHIADWLRDGLNSGRLMGRRPPVTRTRLAVYPTWVDKARSLQDRKCDVCCIWAGPGMPVSFDVPMEPFSAQCSSSDLRFYKEEISSYVASNRLTAQGWRHQPVCITVVAIVSQMTRLKDADNLVKGFLDALQDVLFENDRAIQHLEVLRLRPKIPAGGYLVTARPVRALEDDIMDQSRDVKWRRRIPSAHEARLLDRESDAPGLRPPPT
jgi:hypothetical protein